MHEAIGDGVADERKQDDGCDRKHHRPQEGDVGGPGEDRIIVLQRWRLEKAEGTRRHKTESGDRDQRHGKAYGEQQEQGAGRAARPSRPCCCRRESFLPHQNGVLGIPADKHLIVELAVIGLLAELLDHEHLVADAHLVLNARAERILVVERPLRVLAASSALPRKRTYSGRMTRWPDSIGVRRGVR